MFGIDHLLLVATAVTFLHLPRRRRRLHDVCHVQSEFSFFKKIFFGARPKNKNGKDFHEIDVQVALTIFNVLNGHRCRDQFARAILYTDFVMRFWDQFARAI